MTADQWVCWYARHASELGAPGQLSITQHARIYDPKCKGCGYKVRNTKTKGVKEPVEVCGGCGRHWGYEDRYGLRVMEPKRRRRGGRVPSDDKMIRFLERHGSLARIDGVIARMYGSRNMKWAARVYFQHALGFSTREIAEEARKLTDEARENPDKPREGWARAPFPWNHIKVFRLVHKGRDRFTEELERIGCHVLRFQNRRYGE